MDFEVQPPFPLVFGPEDERLPVCFQILPDNISENTESFRIFLTINESSLGFGVNQEMDSAIINIIDNDSECST